MAIQSLSEPSACLIPLGGLSRPLIVPPRFRSFYRRNPSNLLGAPLRCPAALMSPGAAQPSSCNIARARCFAS